MEKIQDLLSRLTDLSTSEIVELEGELLSQFTALETEENLTVDHVQQLTELADTLGKVRGESQRRTEVESALAAQKKEAIERVHASDVQETAPEVDETSTDISDVEPTEEESVVMTDEMPVEAAPAETDSEPEVVVDEVTVPVDEAPTEEVTPDEDPEKEDEEEAIASVEAATATASTEDPTTDQLSTDEEDTVTESDSATQDDETDTTELATDVAATEELATDVEETSDEQSLSQDSTPSTAQEEALTNMPTPEEVTTAPVSAPDTFAPVSAEPAGDAVTVSITAGADIPGYGAGSTLSTMTDVAKAFSNRLSGLRNVSGGTVQQVVATLAYEYPDGRHLNGDDSSNAKKIIDVASQSAITAAAGICAPLETRYDVSVCGDDARPIRDSLVRFAADRGGVRIYPTPSLATGVGTWNPATPTVKTCGDAVCPTEKTVTVKSIYACLKFNNFTNRYFPEVVQANTDTAMINHARQAEINLISGIRDASTLINYDPAGWDDLGIARTLILVLRANAAHLRRSYRLAANAVIRTILPGWVLDAMIADLALQMPGDGLDVFALSEARITSILRESGIEVTWSLDSWDAIGVSQNPTLAGSGFEVDLAFPVFPEGTFLFLDGGTLDLGIQRDGTMLSANEYATFVETFENVAKVGCGARWLASIPVRVSGAAAALVATSGSLPAVI